MTRYILIWIGRESNKILGTTTLPHQEEGNSYHKERGWGGKEKEERKGKEKEEKDKEKEKKEKGERKERKGERKGESPTSLASHKRHR